MEEQKTFSFDFEMSKEKSTPKKLGGEGLVLDDLSSTLPKENLNSTRKRIYLKSEEKQADISKCPFEISNM